MLHLKFLNIPKESLVNYNTDPKYHDILLKEEMIIGKFQIIAMPL